MAASRSGRSSRTKHHYVCSGCLIDRLGSGFRHGRLHRLTMEKVSCAQPPPAARKQPPRALENKPPVGEVPLTPVWGDNTGKALLTPFGGRFPSGGPKDVEFVAAVLVGLGFEFDKTDPGVGTFYRRSIAPMMQ